MEILDFEDKQAEIFSRFNEIPDKELNRETIKEFFEEFYQLGYEEGFLDGVNDENESV